MTKLQAGLCALVFSLVLPVTAGAEQVSANKTTVLDAFSVFNEDTCGHLGQLDYSIRTEPKNGTIDVRYEKHRLEEGRCAGRVAGIMVIRYTPNRGFRGQDKATVVMRYPEFVGGSYKRSRHFRYNLDVR